MASRLRAQDVAALQRALESERYAARSAQERNKELQQALDSERSAVRALKREAAAKERALREEDGKKYAALVEQLKSRQELAKSEAVVAERENTTRILTSQFQRELHVREEEWRRETKKQLELLQEQLRDAQQREMEAVPIQSQTDSLVHSLHADFHRNLRQKQEEWRRESNAQVEALTNQLRELQRMYTDTCNKLTTTTNEAETVPKLRQEIQTLKLQNKELEERNQVLTDAERRKVEEFRGLHEESAMRIAELQRAARKEAFQLLEEMKSKDRMISQLQREYHLLAARLRPSQSPGLSPRGRSRLNSETSTRAGEPMRNCVRKPKSLSFASDWNKRLRAQEGRKPPDPPEAEVDTTIKEDDQKNEDTSILSSQKTHEAETPVTFDSADIKNWTEKVGVDNLYQLLLEEHQELQMTHHNTMARLREEERIRTQLEDQLKGSRRSSGEGDNAINIALAEQIQILQDRQVELETEAQELREQNDLLEFRILELDDVHCAHSCNSFHFKSSPSRSPDTRDREIDDVSDSGVISLPTSEDISEADFQDYKLEPNNRDVKSKLAQLCQSLDNVSERISVQQALSLLRHYESRLENLEATLAAMCQEATQTKTYDPIPAINGDHAKSPSRIIATVLPFTDLSPNQSREVRDEVPLKRLVREQDCMQESGIFEEGGLMGCLLHAGTQTDWTTDPPPGDLGAEIRKLTQIRERIEEKGGNKKLLKPTEADSEFLTQASFKDLIFYRERAQVLEDKLAIYESRGDDQSKLLAMRLEKEVLLAAQLKHLQNTVRHLKEENRYLEEEKCEYEEAENDTRLRCQKLEVKLSALGEKKSDLQVQLQQNARTMSNLRSSICEEERKRNEARQYAAKLEALVNKFEQQHFEMEEKEMEIRYRLYTLENVVPAMVMYYMWRMLNSIRPCMGDGNTSLAVCSSSIDSSLVINPSIDIRRNMNKKFSIIRPTHFKLGNKIITPKVDDKEQFLNIKQHNDYQLNSQLCSDASFVLIEELSEKCHSLEERIEELELKEKVYQETLQNGDEIFNKMEMDYKQQLKHIEEELAQKQTEVEKAESQLRKYSIKHDHESQLQDRVNQLETELLKLQEVLAQRDKGRTVLEKEKERLTKELDEAINNLETFKQTVEKPLSEEVEQQKLRVKELLGDLDKLEQEKLEDEELHKRLVKELKKVNNLACRQLDENEVTISELKEEVQTLEREVGDLRRALRDERDQNERQLIRVGAELEAKDQEIRNLNGSHSPTESLHEELLHADLGSPIVATELPVDCRSISDISVSNEPTKSSHRQTMGECQRAELIIKEYESNQFLNSIDQLTSAYQHSRTCDQCKNTVEVELRRILSVVQKNARQGVMAQINHLLLLR